MFERGFNLDSQREVYKKKVFGLARWAVLGASLLMPGCSDFKSGLSSEKAEAKKTQTLENFDFANSFPTDEAVLNAQAEADIKSKVEEFLGKYNSKEKFTRLNLSRISIEVSSDERPTKKWDKGNEGLSTERLKVLDTLLRKIIESYNFSEKVSSTSIRQFQRKTFTKRIAAGAWGAGFTPLTQLINPTTKTRYTEGEIKKLTSEQKSALYEKARYARVAFELPGENEIEEQYGRLVEIMASYDNITILADRSESMSDDYGRLSKKFGEAYSQMPSDFKSDSNHVVTFEQNVDLGDYKDVAPDKMQETLANLRLTGGNERALTSIEELLEKKFSVERRNAPSAVIVLTDEGIQDFSWSKLSKINEFGGKNNVDIYFALVGDNGLITFVDRQGLVYEFEQHVKRFSNEAYFPPGGKAEDIHAMFESKVSEVQLDDEGNLLFKFDNSDLLFNLREYYDRILHEIRTSYENKHKKIKDEFDINYEKNLEKYNLKQIGQDDFENNQRRIFESREKQLESIGKEYESKKAELNKKNEELLNQLRGR